MQNLVCEWVDVSKFYQIWTKIGSNLRIFWKNWVILLKNWTDWYMNGSLFLEKFVFIWVYFQTSSGMSLPKPNLSTPQVFRPLLLQVIQVKVYGPYWHFLYTNKMLQCSGVEDSHDIMVMLQVDWYISWANVQTDCFLKNRCSVLLPRYLVISL